MLKEANDKQKKHGGRRSGAGRKEGAKAKLPEEFKERWRKLRTVW